MPWDIRGLLAGAPWQAPPPRLSGAGTPTWAVVGPDLQESLWGWQAPSVWWRTEGQRSRAQRDGAGAPGERSRGRSSSELLGLALRPHTGRSMCLHFCFLSCETRHLLSVNSKTICGFQLLWVHGVLLGFFHLGLCASLVQKDPGPGPLSCPVCRDENRKPAPAPVWAPSPLHGKKGKLGRFSLLLL